MRSLVALTLAWFATAASAAVIEVSPGPGMPLQDAIDAAAPRDKLLVRAGSYPEAIVIAKPLRIVVDRDATIGGEPGSQVSDCASAFLVDITTPGPVTLKAKGDRNARLHVNGGGVAAIRIGPQANVKMTKVTALSWCDGAGGLVIDDAARVKITSSSFFSFTPELQGGPACRITQPGPGSILMKGVRCDGSIAGGTNTGRRGGPGLLLQNVSSAARVKLMAGVVVSCGSAAAVLESTDGVWMKGGWYEACPYILGQPPYFAVTLDDQCDGNRVERATLAGPVLDAGTGNCFVGNEGEDGSPLPDDCL